MSVEIPLSFLKDPETGRSAQEEFFYATQRNECFSGGYGNGKTMGCCMKLLVLLTTFPNYRVAIVRKTAKDLRQTTLKTFFKLCPAALYEESKGGRRSDTLGELRLINGSEVIWFHLDQRDSIEGVIKGLEINSVFIDQAEEVDENVYIHLDGRIGRWDMADVPFHLNPERFPHNPVTNKPIVPAYMFLACNPDSELHWIFQRYHPDSDQWKRKYSHNHIMIQAGSEENPALSKELLDEHLSRDDAYVRRFVKGIWGIPEGQIHKINDDSYLFDVDPRFLEQMLNKGALFRVLDHGDTGITCCVWFSAYKDWHFVYREYYKEGLLISEHRKNIDDLSVLSDGRREPYCGNYADPSIFKKSSQKYGGFWSVADEYHDTNIEFSPIFWQPADNNEPFTRSRVNELLKLDQTISHPITGKIGAPRIYFVMQTEKYPHGCHEIVTETRTQKRKVITTINGKPIFSDERTEISDHAYDTLRYYAGVRPMSPGEIPRKAEIGSFSQTRRAAIAKRNINMDWANATPGANYLH